MNENNFNKYGVTLLEVLLSSIIFLVSVAGLLVTMNAVRGPVMTKENQLTATVFGKRVLEALYASVDNNTYFTTSCVGNTSPKFDLSPCTHTINAAAAAANSRIPWPPPFTQNNCNVDNGGNPQYQYDVLCSDGSESAGNNCEDTTKAHAMEARQVQLTIKWWDVIAGVCKP